MTEKYKVIVDKLELELKRMRAEGKTRLPSESDLCKTYSCSRQTIRAALDVLLHKGLIEKRRGSGSFISDDTFTSRTVFFMTEDCDRYLSPSLISGLKEQLSISKYILKTFSTGGSIKSEKEILLKVISERPAALIIEPVCDLIPDPNSRLLEKITDMKIPVIYCNSVLGNMHVVPDNEGGAKEMTKHFLETGRKKTAGIFRIDDSTGRDRYQGYINALSDADLFDESRCLLLSYRDEKEILSGRYEKLMVFAEEILTDCDAVICQNGMIADLMESVLHKKGVSVPDDIVVADFDSSYGYDKEQFCKGLARTAVALAEGREAKSVIISMNSKN